MTTSPARNSFTIRQIICGVSLVVASGLPGRAADLLVAGKPLAIAGTHGKFDFIALDAEGRRLLAAHTGNASLDVIDIDKQEVLKIVPTGAAQSCAMDAKAGRYFVSVSKPPQLVIVDAGKLEVTGKVPLAGPADLLACDAKSGKIYVCHDDGKDLWVIDPSEKKVVATIDLPSDSPEDLAFDASFARLFQSMKTGSVIAVIDVASGKVVEKWPTAPATAPHGMAVVPEAGAFLVAGGNGKLVLMSQKDGHVISSADIAARVDQIAYDASLHRVYCASATGKIVVMKVEKDKLSALGDVVSSEGARSIAVDPKTHTVWIAYAKGESSFVQSFTPAK